MSEIECSNCDCGICEESEVSETSECVEESKSLDIAKMLDVRGYKYVDRSNQFMKHFKSTQRSTRAVNDAQIAQVRKQYLQDYSDVVLTPVTIEYRVVRRGDESGPVRARLEFKVNVTADQLQALLHIERKTSSLGKKQLCDYEEIYEEVCEVARMLFHDDNQVDSFQGETSNPLTEPVKITLTGYQPMF